MGIVFPGILAGDLGGPREFPKALRLELDFVFVDSDHSREVDMRRKRPANFIIHAQDLAQDAAADHFSRFVETTAVVHEPPSPRPETGGDHKDHRMPSPLYSGGARGGTPTVD